MTKEGLYSLCVALEKVERYNSQKRMAPDARRAYSWSTPLESPLPESPRKPVQMELNFDPGKQFSICSFKLD